MGRTRERQGATRAQGRENATRDDERQGAKTGNAMRIVGRHSVKTGSPREETCKDYWIPRDFETKKPNIRTSKAAYSS